MQYVKNSMRPHYKCYFPYCTWSGTITGYCIVMAAKDGSDLPIVSLLLVRWKPMYIRKFDLGIGGECLPRVLVGDTDDKLTELTSDVTECLSSLPDVGSVMN